MKTNKLLIGLMACSMSLTACTATTDNVTTQPTDSPIVLPTESTQPTEANITTEPTDGTGDTMNIDIGMYKNFVNKNENWLFSPYSIKDAFSLLYEGTEGKVKDEFETVLGLNEESVAAIREYDAFIKTSDTDSIKIANRAYVSNDDKIRNTLDIDVLGLDKDEIKDLQVDDPKAAAEDINTFVSDTTNEKIENFISEDFINEDTSLILVNALYFNQAWDFDKGTILWSDGKQYKAFQNKDYSLSNIKEADDGAIDVLRLNYINDESGRNNYAMTIFCKSENATDNHVDQYFESLSDDEFRDIMNFKDYEGLKEYGKAEFYVPNFEFENKCSLMNSLQDMGMIDAFSSADGFKKLGPVCISDVVHATYIKTNETGTEAAAATGIGMKMMSAQIEEKVKMVRANDTFVFVISDTDTDDILFMGRVVQPTEPVNR